MGQAVDVLGLVGSTIEQVVFDACVDAGGFGLIYKGRHTGLDEAVAIKCLRMTGLQSSDASLREAIAGRFRDETKLLYRLSQGSLDIVRCIGSGTLVAPKTNEITPYMVLEWLDGSTLTKDLRDRREAGQKGRSLEEAVALLDSAAAGITYAHSQGIVHRDIKPGNLFLTQTREGVRCKVLDFGLAKILDMESLGVKPSVETGLGVHFCSPSYGAPEQFTPKMGPIGPWTDIYSLALVLLEVLVGEKVRPAASLAQGMLAAIDPAKGSPTATSLGLTLPRDVEALLARAVAINPLERPHDAGVFWPALKDVMKKKGPPLLAATIADSNVADAMQRIRDLAVAAAQTPNPGGTPKSALAGTMMMPGAPSAQQLMAPVAPVAPTPTPAAGAPPWVDPNAKITGSPRSSPLAQSMFQSSPPPPPAPAVRPPGSTATAPLAQPMSAPIRSAPGAYPSTAPPPSHPAHAMPNTVPPARMVQSVPPATKKKGGGGAGIIVVLLILLLAAGGFAEWWFRFRHLHHL